MRYIIFLVCSLYSSSAAAQQYGLLPTSLITVDGTSTLHDWTVTAEKHSGSITITTKKAAKDMLKKGRIITMSITIPVSNIKSQKGETMNNKMHSALKMGNFPNVTYTLSNPIEFDLIDPQTLIISTTGVLTIAGVKKTIQNTVKATFNNGVLIIAGKFPFKLSDFDVEPPSAMFGQIETGDRITVNFRLKYKK